MTERIPTLDALAAGIHPRTLPFLDQLVTLCSIIRRCRSTGSRSSRTRDIDLLARASNDLDSMRTMIAEICAASVEDDGLSFDTDSIVTGRIAEDAEYEGVRATFQGKLATARAPMQIDVGFSDVVTPEPVSIEYLTVLAMPAPRLWAYNRETAIAEKFEAMVKLGELNSRMKDFFDI